MGFSDYLKNALLCHVFKIAPYTQPTNIYVGLYTVAPTDAGGGTEVSGGAYARKLHNAWIDTANKVENEGQIAFNKATAAWGNLVAWGKFDALSGDNLLVWGMLGKAYSTLGEEITASDTTVTVASGTSYPTSGTVRIEEEQIIYTGKTGNDLTGCTRGANGTTAHAHALGHDVYLFIPKTIGIDDTAAFEDGDLFTMLI